MSDVLLPVAIALPLVAATLPIALGLRYDDAGWPVAAVATTALVGLAAAISVEVAREGTLSHALGTYEPPIGIELVADELSVAVLALIALVSLATLAFARVAGPRGNAFYSGYLLLVGGLTGLVLTGDLFNMFVFLEIVGISTYALIAADRSGASAYASLKYLVVGTVGASLYLLGVGYAFLATGTLNMLDMQVQIVEQASYADPLIRASYALIVAGLGLKIAVFPVHAWQPDAYQRAPDAVTTIVAALVSTASAYALIRVSYTVFTVDFLAANDAITTGMLIVAGASILAGSVLAAMQSDLKRMFAYSSVAQFGMIVAAVALANETALLGGIVHLVGHGLLKFGLFLGIGLLALGYGARGLDDLASAARSAPYTAGAVAVLGLGLVGIPPSIGFLGKWYIGVGAIESSMAGGDPAGIGIAVVIFVSTLFTLSYVARVIERFYFAGVGVADGHGDGDHGGEHGDGGSGHDDGSHDTGVAAADGGRESVTDDDAGPLTSVADAPRSRFVPDRVPPASLAILIVAALTTVVLGFTGYALFEWFDPFLTEVFA